MENKITKYLALTCFALLAAINWASSLIFGFDLWYVLHAITYILIAISLFKPVRTMPAIGFSLLAIYEIYRCANVILLMMNGLGGFESIRNAIRIAAYILLVFASINKKSTKLLSILAAIGIFLDIAMLVALHFVSVNWRYVFVNLVSVAGVVLWGLTYNSLPQKVVVTTISSTNNKSPSTKTAFDDNKVEKLMRLKTLLDNGVITQEEFNKKKKQLLGL